MLSRINVQYSFNKLLSSIADSEEPSDRVKDVKRVRFTCHRFFFSSFKHCVFEQTLLRNTTYLIPKVRVLNGMSTCDVK